MTKVKICGLSTVETVDAAVQAGADYLGFVFAPSRRQVTFDQVRYLTENVPARVKKVGVFVAPTLAELETAIASAGLDLVQIHGNFDDKNFSKIKIPTIRAYQVKSSLEGFSQEADFLLFDAPLAGSGKSFDWNILDNKQIKQPFFVAGGLNSDNVQAAIERFAPYAVDVSSGVESNGQKSPAKIRQFIERVKHGIQSTK